MRWRNFKKSGTISNDVFVIRTYLPQRRNAFFQVYPPPKWKKFFQTYSKVQKRPIRVLQTSNFLIRKSGINFFEFICCIYASLDPNQIRGRWCWMNLLISYWRLQLLNRPIPKWELMSSKPRPRKNTLPAQEILDNLVILEFVMVLGWLALLITISINFPTEVLPLLVYGLHLASTSLAFSLIENIEERIHGSTEKGTLSFGVKSGHIQWFRQYSWILLLLGALITDVFSLVNFIQLTAITVQALRILIMILLSLASFTTTVYLIIAMLYSTIDFKNKVDT